MKDKWKKLWNPNNIDFKQLDKMSKEELNAFVKELYLSELRRLWIEFTFLVNYIAFNNSWQYVFAIWLNRM